MPRKLKSEADHIADAKAKILKAALVHVPFDGWSDAVLALAVSEAKADAGLAKQAFPRGGIDLALAFHLAGDAVLVDQLAALDMAGMRFRERVAQALWLRLEIAAPHREAVRRGVTFFALPQNAAEGAKAVWHTADVIWTVLGDTSQDVNYYTKRATLSAVWSVTVLYWLGDDSTEHANTRAFIDRRIENVMAFETFKSRVKDSPFGKLLQSSTRMFTRPTAPDDLPGKVS
jgi:ubiquinone biosynthesis protein COQ9